MTEQQPPTREQIAASDHPWYVHILGPDDIEGPFRTMEHALRHAAQINSWLTMREDPITDATPMLWAVPTRSASGTTDVTPEMQECGVCGRRYPASDPRGTCPVCWPGFGEYGQQPTPSAEQVACPHWEPGKITMSNGCTACAAEPVSIADTAPGTTFTARHVDPDECGGIDHRWFVIRPGARPLVISDEGQHWSGDSVDPSTIRDVTPPPATPEEGDRG